MQQVRYSKVTSKIRGGKKQSKGRKETLRFQGCVIKNLRTCLMLQWVEICLSMQRTRVPSLVREDRTSLGATKLVCHTC